MQKKAQRAVATFCRADFFKQKSPRAHAVQHARKCEGRRQLYVGVENYLLLVERQNLAETLVQTELPDRRRAAEKVGKRLHISLHLRFGNVDCLAQKEAERFFDFRVFGVFKVAPLGGVNCADGGFERRGNAAYVAMRVCAIFEHTYPMKSATTFSASARGTTRVIAEPIFSTSTNFSSPPAFFLSCVIASMKSATETL